MSTLSDNIKALRGNISQGKAAAMIGIKQQQWARYENGSTVPGADMLSKICTTFKVSADKLLGLQDSGSSHVIGNNNAVAIGANATATSTVSATVIGSADCRKCPYKKAVSTLQKAGLVVPGL